MRFPGVGVTLLALVAVAQQAQGPALFVFVTLDAIPRQERQGYSIDRKQVVVFELSQPLRNQPDHLFALLFRHVVAFPVASVSLDLIGCLACHSTEGASRCRRRTRSPPARKTRPRPVVAAWRGIAFGKPDRAAPGQGSVADTRCAES